MPKYNDAKNREWTIELNANVLRSIKPENFQGVNLCKPEAGQLFAQLREPMIVADICAALCAKQAAAAGIDAESFGDGMAGQAIDDARAALIEAVIEFQPVKSRELLRLVAKSIEYAEAIALEGVTEKFTSGEIDRAIAAAMADQAAK